MFPADLSADIASLLYSYGSPLVFLIAFASCLALPVPASLAFMAAGTFAASGDFELITLWASGLGGAVTGDQAGYFLAHTGFSKSVSTNSQQPVKASTGIPQRKLKATMQSGITRAEAFFNDKGASGIFLSRWLFSPLGPWINFLLGGIKYNWLSFSVWGILGEIVWVTLYIGIGYKFSEEAQAVADIIGSGVWLIMALGLTIWLGRKLLKRIRN